MRKLAYTAFIAFWASVATVAVLFAVSEDPVQAEPEETNGLPAYTWDEIARHDSLDSCWKVIEGKVYDVTDYIPEHPTPPSIMEAWCGKESTEAMRTKGYGRDHTRRAWAMLDDMLIGTVAEDD